MLRCLLKQQWRKALFLILLFCGVYALQEETETVFIANTVPYQKAYLMQFDLSERDAVFAQLDEDEAYTRKIHNAIQYYEGYTGDIPEGALSIMEILSGSAVYADYDMLIWQDAMWDAPGIFAETVFYDFMTIFQLSSRLENQRYLEYNLENQKEIMRRGIKRGGEKLGMYHYTLNQLNSINTDNYMGAVQATSLLIKNDCDILIHINSKVPETIPALAAPLLLISPPRSIDAL